MHEDSVRKAMLREVYLRNLIARFTDINASKRGIAAVPKVGVFWYDMETDNVYSVASSIRDADDYSGLRVGSRQHFESWADVVTRNPKWRGAQYEDIPRGRVVLNMAPRRSRFLIYASPVLNGDTQRTGIRDEFLLPDGHYVFDFNDEHYRLR